MGLNYYKKYYILLSFKYGDMDCGNRQKEHNYRRRDHWLACAHYLINQGENVTIIEEKQTDSVASHDNRGLFRQLFDKGTLACDFEDKGMLAAYLLPKVHEEIHDANAFHEPFGLGYKKTVLGVAEYMRNPAPPPS